MSNRQMIAEIYESQAEKRHLEAMNSGGRDDIGYVIQKLGEAAELESRAQLYRDIDNMKAYVPKMFGPAAVPFGRI